jgi:hypothetical protein
MRRTPTGMRRRIAVAAAAAALADYGKPYQAAPEAHLDDLGRQ